MSDQIDAALLKRIESRTFPGAAYAYGRGDQVVTGVLGTLSYTDGSPWVSDETTWDLASVSKVMGTTMAAYFAVREGLFRLDDPVSKFLPETKLGSATVRNLLRHNSGIAPYADLAGKLSDAGEVRKRILTMAPECSPGKMTAYSCLGFITLMAIVERTSRMGLAEFLHEQFFAPAGIEAFYRPMPHWFVRCAPTERTPIWRREVARKRGEGWSNGEFVQGSVHDPLAYLLGGVSGNAGLFATIRAVAQFGSLLAQNHDLFGGGLMEWVTVASSESSRALGFDTKSPEGSSAGTKFGPRSFGHTGYTGTCLWVDPDADIFGVLLTNRVHPDDHGAEIAQARPEFFDLAYAAAIEL